MITLSIGSMSHEQLKDVVSPRRTMLGTETLRLLRLSGPACNIIIWIIMIMVMLETGSECNIMMMVMIMMIMMMLQTGSECGTLRDMSVEK